MSFEQILGFIQNQNEFIIYGIVLISSFIENIFPPYPGDSVTLAGAIVAGFGSTTYVGVFVSATLGGFLGAMFLYYLGGKKGRPYFARSRYFGENTIIKVERLFSRFGNFLIFFSRFFAGIRSAVSIFAGLGNVGLVRMSVLTALSFIVWNSLLLTVVFYTKSNWDLISDIGRKYNYIILTILLVLAGVLIVRWIWERKKN